MRQWIVLPLLFISSLAHAFSQCPSIYVVDIANQACRSADSVCVIDEATPDQTFWMASTGPLDPGIWRRYDACSRLSDVRSGTLYYTHMIPPEPEPFCDGKWGQVRWTPGRHENINSCDCHYSCLSCPPEGDVFPDPNPGQETVTGGVIRRIPSSLSIWDRLSSWPVDFTELSGFEFTCECKSSPGKETGCSNNGEQTQ